ncbi:MAG: hypothetical protein IPJ00_08490 [Saprospirales bacterium]|nr:hypothetical protein [Saprospirales bacterium]
MHYKKIILGALALLVLLGVFLGSKYYRIYFKPVVPQGLENYFVEIPTGSSGGEVEELLMAQGIISDQEGFRTVAERLKYYRDPMRPGRYEIQPGWNHLQLIRHLGEDARLRYTWCSPTNAFWKMWLERWPDSSNRIPPPC